MSQSFDFDSSKQWAILALTMLSFSLSIACQGIFTFDSAQLKLSSEALYNSLRVKHGIIWLCFLNTSSESFDCAFSTFSTIFDTKVNAGTWPNKIWICQKSEHSWDKGKSFNLLFYSICQSLSTFDCSFQLKKWAINCDLSSKLWVIW